ncbi:carboxypeptidase Taq [Angomonas deanei]|nr:carboxypeptidase Taq [Angomonas deanei]|eukprot:EPY27724.1 carboxypeptidase Taq [Angomonas deanei]
MQSYTQLESIFSRIYRLNHLLSLAGWDAQVNMPPKGAEARGEAMSELERYTHELLTSPVTKDLLEKAKLAPKMSPMESANLREMRRLFESESLLPEEFVQRKSKLTTKAQVVWQESREKNSFQTYLPVLKELVATAREEGKYRSSTTNMSVYEALLDVFEPGMNLKTLDAVFADVKSWLPSLLKQVVEKQEKMNEANPIVPITTPISKEKQEALGKHMMGIWQFDLEAGRLDSSAHPFTGMTKEDTRITTNYNPTDVEQSLYAVIHETGHAKYEQNCGPREMITQPICNARSLGLHESQSLFAEMQVGRSAAFSAFLTPLLKEFYGEQPSFQEENLKRIAQKVKPGFIRVHADEVSYPLHIILRYEIERALIEGTMEAEDVPKVWNAKMKEYLGLDPVTATISAAYKTSTGPAARSGTSPHTRSGPCSRRS